MKQETSSRDRLVEAAIALFWRQGYAAVSVDQLCEAADVKKGSFYHFFSSKEDLALAAIDAHWERRRPDLDALFSPSLDALERLDRYFHFVIQRQSEVRKEHGRVLGCFYFSLATGNVDQARLNARVREIIEVYERYYCSALAEANQTGALKVAEPAAKAKCLLRYLEGMLADARLHDNVESLNDLPRLAWEFLGVTPPPLRAQKAAAKTNPKTSKARL